MLPIAVGMKVVYAHVIGL